MRKLLVILMIVLSGSLYAADLTLYTGELPPYSFTEQKELKGICADLMKEVTRRLGVNYPVKVLPWARSVTFSEQPNSIIFPLARIASREKNYIWVGPVVPDAFVFYVRHDDTGTYKSATDFKGQKVGVLRRSAMDTRLTNHYKFTKLDKVSNARSSGRKLIKGRIKTWYTTRLLFQYITSHDNMDRSLFKEALVDVEMEIYFGFSRNLSGEAARWQDTIGTVMADGTFNSILKSYGMTQ